MGNKNQDDLDLLMSLDDDERVLETPPGSPSSPPGQPCSLNENNTGSDFSLSVHSAKQMVKLGVSADYGVCTAKRKDGTRAFCKIHKLNASDKFATMRSELKGGNLRRSFRDPKSQRIYTVEPPVDRSGNKKANQPVRVLSVEGLRKALNGADKVTPNVHSQGIRFLNEMASIYVLVFTKQSALKNVNLKSEIVNMSVEKRKASNAKETQVKRKKEAHSQETLEVATGKMMVLDFCKLRRRMSPQTVIQPFQNLGILANMQIIGCRDKVLSFPFIQEMFLFVILDLRWYVFLPVFVFIYTYIIYDILLTVEK
ncbi:hypothetical protein Bca4012_018657 [Brassica carinata]|uniref:Uncharacterized protein n=1 Tax=Brassica carinata TaxID=52824 RepID=A0A8X7WLA5_BRACI|nr:hypothetical protein Bca52824_002961 [Brassica carinata]